ncbi:MAG TPA: rhomboid family intramembrane serine protease [Gemmatimonadaceae bacterium]|nr:rhomboid family intramembrane serine protease [Gemmatimonadaceae bacterium]
MSEQQPAEQPLRIDRSMLATPAASVAGAREERPRRRDFERGMSVLPTLTLLLILANVLSFIHQTDAYGLASAQAIVAAGGLARDRVLLEGEIWRLWSAAFLHGGLDHLLGNMVCLYIVGMALEHGVGLLATVRVYVISATAASLASVLTDPGPSVGASGAIFGLLGALLVLLHRHRDVLAMRDNRIFVVLGAWALLTLVLGAANPHIDNAAHVGGLVAGAIVGFGLKLRLDLPAPPLDRPLRLR